MAKKAGKNELLSLTQLAARLRINRGTLSRKLSGLKFVSGPKGARLYPLSEVEALLNEAKDPALLEARRRKLTAEAELAELKLQRERGELVLAQDVRDDVTEVIRGVHQHFTVTAPATLAPQLRGKSVSQMEATLRGDAEQFFQGLRAEHEGYLREAEGATP
jgi:transcriptional regulator with XRE-family HTH domain